jgi:hypothetical protein
MANVADLLGAITALEALSKLGSKKDEIVKRLAKMIRYARKGIDEFALQRDTLTNTWAEKDENGEIKVRMSPDGKTQVPVYTNEPEFQLRINKLLREEVAIEGEFPEPFKWDNLKSDFQKQPDAELMARLGPFATLD